MNAAVLERDEVMTKGPLASAIAETLTDDFLIDMFGEKEVRWYQRACVNKTAIEISNGAKRILIVLPTGTGKTLTIAAMMSDPQIRIAMGIWDNRPMRVLFVSHRHRLLTQAERTFVDSNNVELITQSMFSDIPQEVIDKGWDVCVLDEAHHEGCLTMQYQLEQIGNQIIIGLTATPDRADGCLIKFDAFIQPISREQAVAEGWLAETQIHSFIDVPSKDKIKIGTDLFENFGDEMGQTMVFVKTKREIKEMVKVLRNLGFVAVGILSQTERELDAILEAFSRGEIQFIVNCNKISEGVDTKGCTDVVLLRQFGSYAQLNQVIGRAARPDSSCNVWELINPLSKTNLDTTVVVGTPKSHRLVYQQRGKWIERMFDYITHATNKQLGIAGIMH